MSKKTKLLQHLPLVAKIIRPTVEETVKELHKMDKGSPNWSYVKSWALAHPIYSGHITKAAAHAACDQIKDPIGAACNKEVVDVMLQDAKAANYLCYSLQPRQYGIRPDLQIPVKPRFFFVKDGTPHIFWLQPWRNFDLSEEQHGIIASIIKDRFMTDEFSAAKLHMLDTSAPSAKMPREPKIFGLDDLPLLTEAQLKKALDRFAVAYDIFQRDRKPKSERTRPQAENPQKDFFE